MTGPGETGPGAEGRDEADLGRPVEELSQLSLDVQEGFDGRVQRRIERRLLVGDFVDLAWTVPRMVLLEMLRVPFEWLSGKR